ncbi:MAG: PEP-CTERM sorting domain-containing protein [Nitrosomonadaceae bacterium]|nr:PEP-CTERM sorting domain-containing protein [Nitrosomonadaceae bacterium]
MTTVSSINNSGQVAGYSSSPYPGFGPSHAFITGPNGIGMTELGTLGGTDSIAYDINDSGQVTGSAHTASGDEHAFITEPDGAGMTDLGTLGGLYSRAYAINDSGEVVGVATTAHGESHAFIFSHGGMTDLSLLAPVVAAGWIDLYASSINNNGQIVGVGYHNGNYEAFLLSFTTAVPEPETYLMLLGGLGLIGYLARRRRK